jgi:hypothetical protein
MNLLNLEDRIHFTLDELDRMELEEVRELEADEENIRILNLIEDFQKEHEHYYSMLEETIPKAYR